MFIPEQGDVQRCISCNCVGDNVNSDAHRASDACQKASKRFNRYLALREEEASRTKSFTVGGTEIKRVTEFKYLGRIVSEDDNDSLAIEANLKKARAKWAMFKRLLTREHASRRVMGYFYKAIVQAILLFGAETWVISSADMRKLRKFHRSCARFITNRHRTKNADGTWTHPSSALVLEDAGLFEIDHYIQQRRDTIFSFVKDRDIYQNCLGLEVDGRHVQQYWWKQSFNLTN